MSVPKFDETFLPILQVLEDGVVRSSGLSDLLLQHGKFNLSEGDLLQQVPSGGNLFANRVAWAKAYLKQGGYVRFPSRGMVELTDKGHKLVKSGKELTLKELRADPDFLANRKQPESGEVASVVTGDSSPQEQIDSGFQIINDALKAELRERLYVLNPYYFERVVLKLFEKMGYGDTTVTSKSRDGGIDGIINQDKLGLEKIYVQAKRYGPGNLVHETHIRDFIGAMAANTTKGIFVTTSSFDRGALEKIRDAGHTIVAVNGEEFVDLMVRYGIGVQVKQTYEHYQIDEDFFDESI